MAVNEYSRARKLAQKAFKQALSEEKYPYLRVLDELLPFAKTVGENDLGLIEIPIELIVGTKTAGRTKAFACNFMPLLDEESEFAQKWSFLCESHINEGIRDPVIACEFMNSYYIIEGNKRVSVLKYSGAVSVLGYVTRIIPAPGDSLEIKVYYEFMDFFRNSGINTIYFTRPGSFKALCRLVGKKFSDSWTAEEREIFSSSLLHFTELYKEKGGMKISITPGDAFLFYLNVYGYDGMVDKSYETLRRELASLWKDLEALPQAGNVSLVMQPEREPEKNLIQKLAEPEAAILKRLIAPDTKLHVGFLYYRTAETSGWTYSHDLGRSYVEDNMKDRIAVFVYDGIETDEQCLLAIEAAVHDGCTVLFTTSPRFLGPSLKAGMKYPQLKILNCSLNSYSGHLRTYYGRLYEAKYLVGMLAGILTDTNQIGYIADFPIFGTPASINAFALGVKTVNPVATVHLAWASEKGCDVNRLFTEAGVSHVSGRDMITPLHSRRRYGLYDLANETGGIVASAIWHWGKFYQRILQTILNGSWSRSPASLSINYWWGISSGMIDMIASKSVPERTIKLIELVKKQIINDEFQIFSGELYDQAGTKRHTGSDFLAPETLIRMDWLVDNISGHIPAVESLIDEAIPMVRIQGIYGDKNDLE
ncbi:MAG: BMP family ABC transporter substrate-binding protein [Lachnospiraceae bacterium]|nr:BMP family ABC transporter substrate-binding protein [Lachnospiraceae bacterium]